MEMRIIENASYEHRKMLRSLSLPHVDLKRLKLIKQDSNLSDDSSSGFKDSGIEGGDDNLENSASEIQADFPSLPSSGIIAPDFPSNGSGMLASEPQSACTCNEDEGQADHVKVIISASGQPVIVTPLDQKLKDWRTLKQHYYPEGGWGWLVVIVAVLANIIAFGMQMGLAVLFINNSGRFSVRRLMIGHWAPVTGWLGALSPSITSLMSPVTIALCRRKSTRLTGVIGGLVSALGCLFTSFANHFHQVFFSYGIVIGVGVAMILDTSTLMVGQYFKRRREFVEIFLVAARGIGISIMYLFIHGSIRSVGWRHGLQALTGVVFSTFILGIFYRSATLYHPQRRAILHLKTQKRKIKDKNKSLDDTPPFFDLSCLKSRTIQIILLSTGVSSLGVNAPIYYLVNLNFNQVYKQHNTYI